MPNQVELLLIKLLKILPQIKIVIEDLSSKLVSCDREEDNLSSCGREEDNLSFRETQSSIFHTYGSLVLRRISKLFGLMLPQQGELPYPSKRNSRWTKNKLAFVSG